MATQVYFNGRLRKLPGAYSKITSGEKNTPSNLDYGKILIIDTGLGANWGGGAGINGELNTGKDSIYKFDNVEDYKAFLKGGLLWKLAEKLFFPYPGAQGVSEVIHVRAITSTAAVMTFTATGGGAAGGTFKFKCKDEGVIGNGVKTSQHLDKGYAYTIETAPVDTAKWVMKVWLGQWKGDHTDGLAFDQIPKANTNPILVVQSPEFDNIATLISWAQTDTSFGNYFVLDATSVVTGLGTVNAADVVAAANPVLASGGTETYGSTDLDDALAALIDVDYQFILLDKYGTTDYNNASIVKIINHIKSVDTSFIKTAIYGAGNVEDDFATSLTIAEAFNTPRVIAVHSSTKETTELLANGFRVWPSIYTAATVLGRICGLAPQIPITNKLIGVDGLSHNLKVKDQERALDKGLLTVIQDQYRGGFKVLQGINTIQDNKVLFNAEGKSHSIQFERIVAQINRELVVNSQTDLLNNENGVNVNTLSPGILKTWTETYLQSRIATADADNLLISFRNVVVTRVDDYYKVSYGIVVNNEITKIFYTGYLFKS